MKYTEVSTQLLYNDVKELSWKLKQIEGEIVSMKTTTPNETTTKRAVQVIYRQVL